MRRALIAVVLLAGCHRDRAPARDDAGSARAQPVVASGLPNLPRSPDGAEELRGLDQRIALHRDRPGDVAMQIGFLLDRASIAGRIEDFEEALAVSAAWVARAPDDPHAWRARVECLLAVHHFADARTALAKVEPASRDRLAATLDEATGHPERALAYRETLAHDWPRPEHLVQYAGTLGLVGKLDAALAVMPRAAAAVRDTTPQLVAWLLFQWGRLLEQRGDFAAARPFYVAARARLATLETTVHLIDVHLATGDLVAARALVREAVATNPHPELLTRAGRLAEARAAWDRYLAALPLAFADHAARFFLGPGDDPVRALALARTNLANRDTREARALVIETALAAADPRTACEVAAPLAVPAASRAHRFLAWKAFSTCDRRADAAALAVDLGIPPPNEAR